MNLITYNQNFNKCRIIAINKNSLYGDENIIKYGVKGVLIRMQDKMSRLHNLIWENKENNIIDESIEDTLLDLINYSNYCIMLLKKDFIKGDKNG